MLCLATVIFLQIAIFGKSLLDHEHKEKQYKG